MSKHLARIGRVDAIKEIPGADNIQTAVVYGFETIVLKSVKVGDIGVFFEAGDTQLSDEFCKNNNLYRHSEFNIDVEKKGYIEDNRRLRVQKFLKVKSEGLFMSLNCLQFTNGDTNGLKFGDAFEEFNGIKICNKFINKNTDGAIGNRRKVRNVQTPIFHQHIDTEQLAYYIDTIPVGSLITISHKTHGCVSWDSVVQTKQYGAMIIKDIVDRRLECEILSFNVESEEVEYCKVLDWYYLCDDGEWYEIETEDGEKLIITGNNPVWLPDLHCYRRVEDLEIGDVVLSLKD